MKKYKVNIYLESDISDHDEFNRFKESLSNSNEVLVKDIDNYPSGVIEFEVTSLSEEEVENILETVLENSTNVSHYKINNYE